MSVNCDQSGQFGTGLQCVAHNRGDVEIGTIEVTLLGSEEMIPTYKSLNEVLREYDFQKYHVSVNGPFAPNKKKTIFIEAPRGPQTVLTRVTIHDARF